MRSISKPAIVVLWPSIQPFGPLSPQGNQAGWVTQYIEACGYGEVSFDTLRKGGSLGPRGNQAGWVVCRGIRIEVCDCGIVSFDTTLRVTQSTGGKSRLSSKPWLTYRSLRYGYVAFDTLRLCGPLSPRGGKSRLSNAVYRSLRSWWCGLRYNPSGHSVHGVFKQAE